MPNTVSRVLSDETLNRIIQIESAGNPGAQAKTSSAAGLGQFITGTWLATIQKHKPKLLIDRTRGEVAAMRVGTETAALQLEMLARFTEDNRAALGSGCTDGDLYLAHFLGLGDARKLFRADPSSPASFHVSEAAVEANKSILAGKTCAEVRAWAQASMEGRWAKAGRPDWVKRYAGSAALPPAPLPDVPKPEPHPAPLPAPSPATKKKVGIWGAIGVAWVAATSFLQTHPFIIGGGIFLMVLIGALYLVLRNRG